MVVGVGPAVVVDLFAGSLEEAVQTHMAVEGPAEDVTPEVGAVEEVVAAETIHNHGVCQTVQTL